MSIHSATFYSKPVEGTGLPKIYQTSIHSLVVQFLLRPAATADSRVSIPGPHTSPDQLNHCQPGNCNCRIRQFKCDYCLGQLKVLKLS